MRSSWSSEGRTITGARVRGVVFVDGRAEGAGAGVEA